jgi:PKHD-type hydroxylase
MNLNFKYYYFQSALSSKMCDDIIKYALSKNDEHLALVGSSMRKDLNKFPLTKEEIKILKKKRNSNVVWLDDQWIYNEIHPYIYKANEEAGWNFEWNLSESCQFTKYSKGQYYGWHCDSTETPYTEEGPLKGKIRKLSVTVSLSNSTDYKGGELEFDFRNKDPNEKQNIHKCVEILPKGSIVVFPSFVWHRVCPVITGTRYSLVIWNLGYPFK